MVSSVTRLLITLHWNMTTRDRIERLSSTIDTLNPFEDKRDFAASILSECSSFQFDNEEEFYLPTTT